MDFPLVPSSAVFDKISVYLTILTSGKFTLYRISDIQGITYGLAASGINSLFWSEWSECASLDSAAEPTYWPLLMVLLSVFPLSFSLSGLILA